MSYHNNDNDNNDDTLRDSDIGMEDVNYFMKKMMTQGLCAFTEDEMRQFKSGLLRVLSGRIELPEDTETRKLVYTIALSNVSGDLKVRETASELKAELERHMRDNHKHGSV